MGRRDTLLANCITSMCDHIYHHGVEGDSHFDGCPFYNECPRGDEDEADGSCFEEILAWLDESDPASELGPGELRAVPKRTPEGYLDHSDLKDAADKLIETLNPSEGKGEGTDLHYYAELLNKLAMAVPLPGSPTYGECVDKAIVIIENYKQRCRAKGNEP